MRRGQVLVGGRVGGQEVKLAQVIALEKQEAIETIKDYQKYFKLGQRIRVQYVRNMQSRDNDFYSGVLPTTSDKAEKLCKQNQPRLCILAKYTEENPEVIWKLYEEKTLPEGFSLPVVTLFTRL